MLTTKDRPAGRADDPFLVDKLLREKEGIFLWCLEGLHRLIGNNYQFSISGKAKENMETVKRSSNNVIEFLQSEGYIRFRADSEASSKAIYEAYTRWCDDNAQKPMSANRVSSELAQNERLYKNYPVKPIEETRSRYFLRLQVADKPGALANIAGVLGNNDVSIAQVVQKRARDGVAELVVITDSVLERHFNDALMIVKGMSVLREVSGIIRVYGD